MLCRALLSCRDAARLVRDVCRHRWRPVRAAWCPRCGQPEPLFGACRLCAEWPAAFGRARYAVWLDGGARDAVHALKYGGLPRIATDLAAAMVGLDVPGLDSGLLIPVPLGRARLRNRGYNQSERLARALACRWGRAVVDLLVRTRDPCAPPALTPEARLANVAGAFETRNAQGGTRYGKVGKCPAFRVPSSALEPPLTLVDDVFT